MITSDEMRNADGKLIRLLFVDGNVYERKCTNFYQQEDEDEENVLEFDDILVNQSEIETIEILD